MARTTKGFRTDRLKKSPEEARFAAAWKKQNAMYENMVRSILTTKEEPLPSVRDERVAATMIQWLGSNVGQQLLGELGYARSLGADRERKERVLRAHFCDACEDALVPGALFPVDIGDTAHAYVQMCDECHIFIDDVGATRAVAHALDADAALTLDQRPYILGLTFNEAEATVQAHTSAQKKKRG